MSLSTERAATKKLYHDRMMKKKMEGFRAMKEKISEGEDFPSIKNQPQVCEDGKVTLLDVDYPCDNVNFLSLVGRSELKFARPDFPTDELFEMSDIWGWKSPVTGREITIAGMTQSVWFIDSTDPLNPKVLAFMESPREEGYWSDIKVYKDVAYIVYDRFRSSPVRPEAGTQIFDLFRLESDEVLNAAEPVNIAPDTLYTAHGSMHNVVIDVESGFMYAVGGDSGKDCDGGLHINDLNQDKFNPVFQSCAAQDGYVHDAQCNIYTGPDEKYFGKELCFGYNEDALVIYDVTDKLNPTIISSTTYETATYTHQGWLHPDQDFLLLDDEIDEEEGEVINTRTYVVNVTSLEAPVFTGFYDHPTISIDHNLYFWGDIHRRGWSGGAPLENVPDLKYAYCANYASGLRVVDTTTMKDSSPNMTEAGFFDVSPTIEDNVYFGAWSTYFHPSGVIAMTSIETGVFFLNFTSSFEVFPEIVGAINSTSAPTTVDEDDGTIEDVTLYAIFLIVMGVLILCLSGCIAKLLFFPKPAKTAEKKKDTQEPFVSKTGADLL